MKDKFDVVIVGAGPAGLYCAYKITSENPNIKIAVLEKGKELKDRKCPAMEKNIKCINCKVCSIMSGVAGAGAFSDAKYPITNDFGGTLWEKIGKEKSLELQHEVDKINHSLFLETKTDGIDDFPKMYSSKDSIYKKICTQHNLHLLDADIRHLGTDIGQVVYGQLFKKLKSQKSISFYCNEEVKKIEKSSEGNYSIFTESNIFSANKLVLAVGRSGSEWMEKVCKSLNIETKANKVDIGVRFECPDEIWNHITKDLYESKIVYRTKLYEDEVRTFCMNPSGAVVSENTNGLITVNGHSFEDPTKKTSNTNFALLVSQSFTEPFNNSSEYGDAIVRLSNMLGGGVIVQRYGDLIRGKRSTKKHIAQNTVRPTLEAEPGDLSLVLPKRILDDIIEMIQKLDHLVPGMMNDDNLLYGVELKRYNFSVCVKDDLSVKDYPGLYVLGDGSGWTHCLSQASASGLFVGNEIVKNF